MPLGWAGGCQISLTDVVLTSGKRMPTGGPGTVTQRSYGPDKRLRLIIQNCIFTIVQGSLQDGRGAAPSIADPCKGQDLDLVEDILAQTRQLDAVAGVALNRPEAGSCVRVLLLVQHLKHSGYPRLQIRISNLFEMVEIRRETRSDLVPQDEPVAIGVRDLPPPHQDAAGGGGEGRHVGRAAGGHCSDRVGASARSQQPLVPLHAHDFTRPHLTPWSCRGPAGSRVQTQFH